jgi:hypothetical protein
MDCFVCLLVFVVYPVAKRPSQLIIQHTGASNKAAFLWAAVQALSSLHAVNYSTVPELATFGKEGQYFARQLKRLNEVSSAVQSLAPAAQGVLCRCRRRKRRMLAPSMVWRKSRIDSASTASLSMRGSRGEGTGG